MDEFNNLLKIICQDLGYELTFISDGWLKMIKKDNKTRFISGYRFDNNLYAVGEVMNDKGMFHDVLRHLYIPVTNQKIIFHDYKKEEVINYFNEHNKEIIIKGNTGCSGKEVFKVNNLDEVFKIIDNLLLKEYSISLSPYYNIVNEYRIIVLNNEVKLIFGKIKPTIYGDGKKNILTLAKEYDEYYCNNSIDIENKFYVPKKDEKVELSYKFNLSSGAKTFLDIPKDLKDKLISTALEVSKKLNITFASIDIIVTDNNEIMVMEANTGVTLNTFLKLNPDCYKIVYNIYKDAIINMFNDEV